MEAEMEGNKKMKLSMVQTKARCKHRRRWTPLIDGAAVTNPRPGTGKLSQSGRQHTWALVLAAGEGTRLCTLTTDKRGTRIPKQFCSLHGDTSLLLDALRRARSFAAPNRIGVVVGEAHRRWWQSDLSSLDEANITVQTANRGTAIGILLPLLSILAQDPFAKVVFLPSDHYFEDEAVMEDALHQALDQVYARPRSVMLLGIQPNEADAELGYIVPGDALAENAFRVATFVEKPTAEIARELITEGAVWNSFILAADGNALLAVYRQIIPDIVDQIETAWARDAALGSNRRALAELYQRLPILDFSSRIAQAAADRLTVFKVPPCGWSDLGTPKRVAETLRRSLVTRTLQPKHSRSPAYFSLAASHAQLPTIG
jgi:mannose-1-phosphate guanylyltransferase